MPSGVVPGCFHVQQQSWRPTKAITLRPLAENIHQPLSEGGNGYLQLRWGQECGTWESPTSEGSELQNYIWLRQEQENGIKPRKNPQTVPFTPEALHWVPTHHPVTAGGGATAKEGPLRSRPARSWGSSRSKEESPPSWQEQGSHSPLTARARPSNRAQTQLHCCRPDRSEAFPGTRILKVGLYCCFINNVQ